MKYRDYIIPTDISCYRSLKNSYVVKVVVIYVGFNILNLLLAERKVY
jgi:hypothetical protein